MREFEWEMGGIPSLVVRMTRSIWGTSHVFLMDSGFGFLPSLTHLFEKGLFGTCIIKKQQHWPKGSDGCRVVVEMAGKKVGELHVRRGVNPDWPKCEVWIGSMLDSKHHCYKEGFLEYRTLHL